LCVLDFITASDDDDVSVLRQLLYESVGRIIRLSLRNFAERLHSLFMALTMFDLGRDPVA